VLLVERGELNREASGTNAGSLHFQILRQDDYSPARLAQIRPSVELHVAAAQAWQTLEAELGADLGVRTGGGLLVAEDQEQLETLKRKVEVENSMGLETELVGTREMLDISPGLSEHLAGADYYRDEGFANPLLVAPAFARRAIAAGARIRLQSPVIGIERRAGGGFRVETATGAIDTPKVVDAAGAWAGQVAELVGLHLPVNGHVLHVNVTEPWAPVLPHLIQHVGRRLTLKQNQSGTFIIGGGWPGRLDPASGRKMTLRESLVGNTWVAAATYPILNRLRVIRTWGGMIASSPDRVPTIGESRTVRGFYAMQCGAGFTLGPVVGRLMAELVHTGRTTIPIKAYDPERFMVAATVQA
jgi:glycine/D-amino acid oxidase-like deaminating enzyme